MNMKQISKRITYLFSLRRKKMNDVLKKYDLKEYEYYLLMDILLNDGQSFEQLFQTQQFNKTVLYEIVHSLNEKGYITIDKNHILITDKFYQIKDSISHDLKKMDDDFSKKIDNKSYNEYVSMLDDLIDYYDD